jgi:hypothetical protein
MVWGRGGVIGRGQGRGEKSKPLGRVERGERERGEEENGRRGRVVGLRGEEGGRGRERGGRREEKEEKRKEGRGGNSAREQ